MTEIGHGMPEKLLPWIFDVITTPLSDVDLHDVDVIATTQIRLRLVRRMSKPTMAKGTRRG